MSCTKVKIKPELPREIGIQTELVIGDYSLRKDNGVNILLVWDNEEQVERGIKMFICQQCLSGKPYSWHDKQCTLFLANQEVSSL